MGEEKPRFEPLVKCLADHDHVPLERNGNELWVLPKDEFGFSVGIVDDGREFTVFHDSWHEHIQDIHNAVICFLVGLTTTERLKVTSCGKIDYRWEAEKYVEER
jgi:hypothetical protein